MILDLIIHLSILLYFIIRTISMKKTVMNKKKKRGTIILLWIVIIFYTIAGFGFSPTAKITYKISNSFSEYEYVLNYDTEDNKALVVSMKTDDTDSKIYRLTVYNKTLGLYYRNYSEYDQSVILAVENDDFEILTIKINDTTYYFLDFDESKISLLEINGNEINRPETSYYLFNSQEDINSLKIDGNEVYWYNVKFPIRYWYE